MPAMALTVYAAPLERNRNRDYAPLLEEGNTEIMTNVAQSFFKFIPSVGGYYTIFSSDSSSPFQNIFCQVYEVNSVTSFAGDNEMEQSGHFYLNCNLSVGTTYYFDIQNCYYNNRPCMVKGFVFCKEQRTDPFVIPQEIAASYK